MLHIKFGTCDNVLTPTTSSNSITTLSLCDNMEFANMT